MCHRSDYAQRQLVRRDDAHAALAGGDEVKFSAAADDADLEGDNRRYSHEPRLVQMRYDIDDQAGSSPQNSTFPSSVTSRRR